MTSGLMLAVQVSQGKILENDIPVFVITFATQEVLCFRNVKTREIVVGAEDRVEQCHYAAVVTRLEEELDNELTGGWKIVEVRILFQIILCDELTNHVYLDGAEIIPSIPLETSRKVPQAHSLDCLYRFHHSLKLLSITYPPSNCSLLVHIVRNMSLMSLEGALYSVLLLWVQPTLCTVYETGVR